MALNRELPNFLRNVSPWELRFSRKYRVELVHRMNEVLLERGISQKELAKRAGWKEPFVSRLLGGDQNLTLKTISRFEEAADADVLVIPLPAEATEESAASGARDPSTVRSKRHGSELGVRISRTI